VKRLLRLFEAVRPTFEKGGRLGFSKPVFEALEHVFFAPSTTTVTAPHVRDPLDIKRLMSMVIIALVPCLIAALYFFGWRLIPMIIVSYTVGGAVEVAFAIIRKEEINEGFLVTGMLFPLILPPALPLWMVGVGIAFGVLVGKELFGGTGRNIFNPAIVGRCFLALAYPAAMSGNWIKPGDEWTGRLFQYVSAANIDAISTATPLVRAKQGILVDVWRLVAGSVEGCMGETSAVAIILGGVFLLLTRVASWRTVVSTLGSCVLLSAIFHQVQPDKFAPALWHLFAGGLLFGVFYMATDPVTSPLTNGGKWVYGITIGVVTVLIRNFTGYVEGVMFAILLGNIAAPIFDEIVFSLRLRRLRNEG
jgi:Na+-transporting NADH:ubiquinone oxidoreductase subunit B/electron transport complex protein RnfD